MSACRSRGRGQALVEFALVFPVVLLIIFGAIDLSRAVWFQSQVQQLADQAARQAAVSDPDGTCAGLSKSACVDAIVADQRLGTDATSTSDCQNADGTSAGPIDSCPIGKTVHVEVSAPWTAVTPIVSSFIGDMTMSSEATLPVE